MISLKAKIWRIALAPALLVFSASAALAQETAGNSREEAMEHKFELASTYYTECKHTESAEFDEIRPYLKAFTDIEVMAKIMANPVETARLMRIVADPRTMHVMMKCSTEPVMWDTWMRGLTDINKMLNASLVFMNPMTYVNWMIAPFQPAVYTNTFSILGPGQPGPLGHRADQSVFLRAAVPAHRKPVLVRAAPELDD